MLACLPWVCKLSLHEDLMQNLADLGALGCQQDLPVSSFSMFLQGANCTPRGLSKSRECQAGLPCHYFG